MNENATVFSTALKRILVVDNDERCLRSLVPDLSRQGYQVFTADQGLEGLALARKAHPNLLLMEVDLPDMSGFEVSRRLREQGDAVPIILIASRADETDLIAGLEAGADDYVTKPFRTGELLARIRARLRRQAMSQQVPSPRRVRFDDVEIDFERQLATRGDHAVALSAREFGILQLLIRHRGETVSRDTMLATAWGYSYPVTTRTVDNHVVKLRRKLEADPAHPKHILSVYGEGYKFVAG